MNEQECFLQALAENEDDVTLRLVYADWLEEHDQPEESNRQRKYPAAKEWLVKFCQKWNFEDRQYGTRGEDGKRLPVGGGDYKEMIEIAQRPANDEEDWDSNYLVANGVDLHSSDELDPGDFEAFWENLEIVTGKQFDQAHREQLGWSCTC